jgi:hypothetical protein
MSALLDHPLTIRSLIRIGLAFAAEYALLALIEDAPAALKIATVICAIGALLALETEAQLKTWWRYSPGVIISALALIYAGFVGYGIQQHFHGEGIKAGLKDKYFASAELAHVYIVVDANGAPDKGALEQRTEGAVKWEVDTEQWIEANIGKAARERFLDSGATTNFGWLVPKDAESSRFNNAMNRFLGLRKNLATMIEIGAWDE